ncbi:MAG: hypothetical protein ACLT98_08315 [Eggerthellaceae bacterium]
MVRDESSQSIQYASLRRSRRDASTAQPSSHHNGLMRSLIDIRDSAMSKPPRSTSDHHNGIA